MAYHDRPGDFVTWKGDGDTRSAVVQSLDPVERTANVRWIPAKEGEPEVATVSVLELDPVRDKGRNGNVIVSCTKTSER